MESRRRIRRRNHTLLPLSRARQLSNTVSCWYCDVKFAALNEPLFQFGSRYSRYLRVWFGMGIGFSLAAVIGVTVVVVCELVQALLFHTGNGGSRDSIFGISSLIGRQNTSLFNIGYLCVSSALSLLVHEFGHAIAAASEGVQMEYVAIFWAILFPGALVAFNDALFGALPRAASLRIYCAGIWHNAVFCAVCTLVLVLLPFILGPFYNYGGSPMVLDVSNMSPLSGYLLPRAIITSVDDFNINSAEDWKHVMSMLNEQAHSQSNEILNVEKGYCIPHSIIKEESVQADLKGNQTYCPDELSAFALTPCLDTKNGYDNGSKENYLPRRRESIRCLDPKEVVKRKKCTHSSFPGPGNRSSCLCSEVESCWTPLERPDLRWVEIKYATLECYYSTRRSRSSDIKELLDNGERSCIQSFVFLGDMAFAAHSIHLTSYKPRTIYFPAYLPHLLEKFLICSFHVSLVLALTNSLPVYFLDGESIVEVIICYVCPSKKRLVLQWCLVSGTIVSVSFILYFTFLFLT